jgi:hypothetical protein
MVHSPDDAILVSPVTNVAAAFYVFIIAHAMYVFIGHAISLLNTIINQNFFTGVDLSGYANISDYTTGALRTGLTPVNYALGRTSGVKAARQSMDSAFRPLSENFSLGRDIENNKKTYPKLSEALQEVGSRSNGLKDKDFDAFMKGLGAQGSKSNKADHAALLENSKLTKDEIVQALLRPPENNTPLTAGGETMLQRLVSGGKSDRFNDLLEKARANQNPQGNRAHSVNRTPGSN